MRAMTRGRVGTRTSSLSPNGRVASVTHPMRLVVFCMLAVMILESATLSRTALFSGARTLTGWPFSPCDAFSTSRPLGLDRTSRWIGPNGRPGSYKGPPMIRSTPSLVWLQSAVTSSHNHTATSTPDDNLPNLPPPTSYTPLPFLSTRSETGSATRAPPPVASSQATSTQPYYRPGSMMAATVERGSVPYGEDSRQFRRTVYTAADWIQHRNSERIISNLKGLFFSGIVRQLQQELWLVCAVSAAVVLLNNSGVAEISLPSLPFQLSSPALGLLLVFRTNASYSRWTEGRATWARIDANSCNMVRMAATFTDLGHPETTHERRRAIQQLSQATWAYSRSLMNQLLTKTEDEDDYCMEMRRTIRDPRLVERILAAPDRTVAAMTECSLALDRLPIDEKRRVEVDKSIVILGDCLSTCEKIYSSPVPLVYTRHTARFLSFWMLLLPAALYEPFVHEDFAGSLLFSGFAVIPAVAVVAIFLFGIEELAVALEEPFSILPMQSFCDGIQQSMNGVLDWCFDSADLEMQDRLANEAPLVNGEPQYDALR